MDARRDANAGLVEWADEFKAAQQSTVTLTLLGRRAGAGLVLGGALRCVYGRHAGHHYRDRKYRYYQKCHKFGVHDSSNLLKTPVAECADNYSIP